MNKPLLSICIPTYNRAEYLKGCLDAIVCQDGFDDRVEVVISDNCSTDNTQKVGEEYQDRYTNIRYYRNEENIIDKNYPLVFQRATGVLKKLTNDTIRYKAGAIAYMLKIAAEYKDQKPQIYFLSSGKGQSKRITSLDEYIGFLGYHLTWIASVSSWDDCDILDLFEKEAHTKLAQVPYLIKDFEKRGQAVICDEQIMDSMLPKNKDLTYGLYNVFYNTFLGYLRPYLDCGMISKECFECVRKGLLFDFFIEWIINKEKYSKEIRFSDENLRELVEKEYKNEPYFNEYRVKLRLLILKANIKEIIKKAIGRI